MEQQLIKISKLKPNTGQIDGLPKNPRKISSFKKDELKKSIIESPELLEYQMLLVYPFEDNYVVIAGNQRLSTCKDLKFKEMPCIVLPVETPVEKLKEYAIKTNVSAGQWDWNEITENWPEAESWSLWQTDPITEKTEKTENVSFQASKDILMTIKFESDASREVLYDRLLKEGYELWIGKRKPKN